MQIAQTHNATDRFVRAFKTYSFLEIYERVHSDNTRRGNFLRDGFNVEKKRPETTVRQSAPYRVNRFSGATLPVILLLTVYSFYFFHFFVIIIINNYYSHTHFGFRARTIDRHRGQAVGGARARVANASASRGTCCCVGPVDGQQQRDGEQEELTDTTRRHGARTRTRLRATILS